MNLPLVLRPDLVPAVCARWRSQFVAFGRDTLEGLWVRTQDRRNQDRSGWRGPEDRRRKLLHYVDRYALLTMPSGCPNLVLEAPYLWLQLAAPEEEIAALEAGTRRLLKAAEWRRGAEGPDGDYRRGDLRVSLQVRASHSEDERRGRRFPPGYVLLELTLRGEGVEATQAQRAHPFQVLDLDIRPRDGMGGARIVRQLEELAPYLPAQVELGCGPSIEAGIPPLHHLHEVYGITERESRRFLLGAETASFLERVLGAPRSFYLQTSELYTRALLAEPTPFYELLRAEVARGRLLTPIITNNFDGLPAVMGLEELYMRTYEDLHVTPEISFHPRARSLLVVGSHADRRRTRRAARDRGLKVIYVDPQGYWDEHGLFSPYPMESLYPEDLLVPMTAAEFAARWKAQLT